MSYLFAQNLTNCHQISLEEKLCAYDAYMYTSSSIETSINYSFPLDSQKRARECLCGKGFCWS